MRYRLLIVWLSIKWMFQINLGNDVWYQGKVWNVYNGVCPGTWHLCRDTDEGRKFAEPLRTEVKNYWSITNMLHGFKSGHSFYTGYWLGIWKTQGIKNWMKVLPIWG